MFVMILGWQMIEWHLEETVLLCDEITQHFLCFLLRSNIVMTQKRIYSSLNTVMLLIQWMRLSHIYRNEGFTFSFKAFALKLFVWQFGFSDFIYNYYGLSLIWYFYIHTYIFFINLQINKIKKKSKCFKKKTFFHKCRLLNSLENVFLL